MKRTVLLTLGALSMAALLTSNAAAQTYLYWDNNGTATPGSGTWNLTTPSWSTDANPTASPVVWDGISAAVFAVTNAGVGNWSTFTVTVDSAINIGGLYNNGLNGSAPVTNVVFTGSGSLNLATGANIISAGNGAIGAGSGNNNIFRIPITGNGSVTFQANVGSEYLAVPNTYSGGTTIDTGNGINFAANNAFGTGTITVAPGRTTTVLATPATDPTGAVFANGPISIPNDFVANSSAASTIIYVANASAPATFSGNWNLGSQNQTLDFRNGTVAAPETISGVISGSGLFTKTGNGVLVLSGNNTYSGKTVIRNGTLSVSSLNRVAGGNPTSSLGAPTTAANGTIDLGTTTTAGVLLYTGAGEPTDRGINLAGTTGGGTIQNDGTGALSFTSDFTATGSGAKTFTLAGANTGNNTISGKIVDSSGGATAVTKSGAGKWILNGANTYSGTTTLSAGTLGIGNASALGTGTFAIGAGSFDNLSGGAMTLANVISLAGNSTFLGSADLSLGGAATLTASRTVTVSANTLTFDGVMGESTGGARKLTKAGNGTLALTKANTFTGGFQINAGTVKIGNDAVFGTGLLTLAGGTIQSDSTTLRTIANPVSQSASTTVGGSGPLNFTGSYTLSGGGRTLTVNNTANTTISGGIIEDGTARKFTKSGTGSLVFSGVNTNTGGTQVSAGTLALVGSGALGSGAITVSTGATLDVSGRADGTLTVISGQTLLGGGTIIGDANIAGILAPGTSAGLLTFNGKLTLESGSQTLMEIGVTGRGTGYDAVDVAGKLTFDGTLTLSLINGYTGNMGDSFQLFNASEYAGVFQNVDQPALANGLSWDLSNLPSSGLIAVVPEPSSIALGLCGVAVLAQRASRRRNG
jgi:autotransporter-associated beta strand protein